MSPVFSHGSLRLYLLKLLEDGPRHGYDMIRALEDQFMGLYAPSAGTIYPRLARLETEGLVVHEQSGGRKVYAITDAGREELDRRRDELAVLEADLHSSVHGLATEIGSDVRGNVRDVKAELRQAARQLRREQRHANRKSNDWRDWYGDSGGRTGSREQGGTNRNAPPFGPLERRINDLLRRTAQLVARANVSEQQVRECVAVLDEAVTNIQRILRESATIPDDRTSPEG